MIWSGLRPMSIFSRFPRLGETWHWPRIWIPNEPRMARLSTDQVHSGDSHEHCLNALINPTCKFAQRRSDLIIWLCRCTNQRSTRSTFNVQTLRHRDNSLDKHQVEAKNRGWKRRVTKIQPWCAITSCALCSIFTAKNLGQRTHRRRSRREDNRNIKRGPVGLSRVFSLLCA